MIASAIHRYCCLEAGHWQRVLGQSESGVSVDPRSLDSTAIWNGDVPTDTPSEREQRFIPWQDLDVPLPHRGARCWGFALSYPEHRRETLNKASFRFLKLGSVATNAEPILYRDYLDYELEIGLLMHRDTPDRFGYFLANDLTDRGLQVEHYNAHNPAPGFTQAKDFPGSLRAGPLLAVGDASLWAQLTASLTLNDQERQTLSAADCRLNPRKLHQELFLDQEEEWLLAVTGTTGGTLFRSPQIRERLRVMVAGRFSPKRARRSWLTGLQFLAAGDRLVLQSPILGRSETHVILPGSQDYDTGVKRPIGTFVAGDGAKLAYVKYLPKQTAVHGVAFVYLHGIESHSGWFDHAATLLNAAGYPVFCIDRRGSGVNREDRGFASGCIPQGVDLIDDLHHAIRQIREENHATTIYLIGLSWGGKYAVAYDMSHPGNVQGLILITPGITPKVDLSFGEKIAVARDVFLSPDRQHRIPIEPEMFTTTPQYLAYIKEDPLRLHTVSARFFWQSRKMDRLLAHGQLRAPVLLFLAGHDRIIDNEETRRFMTRHQGHEVQIIEYADQTHSIQLDAPDRLIGDILKWLESPERNS